MEKILPNIHLNIKENPSFQDRFFLKRIIYKNEINLTYFQNKPFHNNTKIYDRITMFYWQERSN